MTRMPLSLLRALVALALCLVPIDANADSTTAERKAMAQSLFDDALSMFEKQDYAGACPKLEQVVQLYSEGIGAKLMLAECYEKAGRLASAYAVLQTAATQAEQQRQTERKTQAEEHARAIEPRLSHWTIRVPEAVRRLPGVALSCDGAPLAQAQWGLALPADGGKHTVAAKAPGKLAWEATIELAAERGAASIDVPELKDEPHAEVKPAAIVSTWPSSVLPYKGPRQPRISTRAPAQDRPQVQRTVGFVLGGAGLAAGAAGGAAGIIAFTKHDASRESGHCRDGAGCDAIGTALVGESRMAGNVSTGMLIAGGALLAGGVVLVVTAPGKASGAPKIALQPGGIEIRGVF